MKTKTDIFTAVEPTELEKISKHMVYMQYNIYTKDNVNLACILEKQTVSITPHFKRNWKIIFKTKPINGWNWTDILMRQTDEPKSLESVICGMNEYIKANFKTNLEFN